MLTDAHCHLADPTLLPQLSHILTQARAAGICRFIVPATCPQDWQAVQNLAQPTIHIALGIHPWFAHETQEQDWQQLNHLLTQNPRALVGEIGLDFHQAHSPEAREQQQNHFQRQLRLAQHHQRPTIIHNLRASHAIIEAVKQTQFQQGGIVHAFSGSLEEAQQLIACGFLIGIGSLLLNPNAKKAHQAAKLLPLENIVLETDSPFMLPQQINTPSNVRRIAEIVAQQRQIPLATLAAQTEKNIERLFNFTV